MVEIIDGKLVKDDLTKNARGGTELLADRLLKVVDPALFQNIQIIFSRPNKLLDGYRKVLYLHDLPGDPAIDGKIRSSSWRDEFDLIVFVSHYQRTMFGKVYGFAMTENMVVIPNCIEPINDNIADSDRIRLIYHTTPHRGLEILVPVFEHLDKKHPNTIELDVYSSFDIYGWSERDKPYQHLFDRLNEHPNASYSKSVSNTEVRHRLRRADIFAFPSIWEETSCMALMEAMSANLVCVHSDLGALPETSRGVTRMYPFVSDLNRHANLFADALEDTILSMVRSTRHEPGKTLIDNFNNLTVFKNHWEGYLRAI